MVSDADAPSEEAWLRGRVAMVTGAASGLGRATALALAGAGAAVLAADIDEPGLEKLATTAGLRGAVLPTVLDVSDDGSRRSVMAGAFAQHGGAFDVLINVAGIDRPGYANDVDLADFLRVLSVNLVGPTFLMREFLSVVQHRRADRLAEIVNVISISAITVGSGAAAYNGSKAALAKVTEIVQREILEFGWPCRLQGIMPAAMDTPMMERWGIPAERMMPPSAVAAEILHCLHRSPSSYGQNLVVVPRLEPDFPR